MLGAAEMELPPRRPYVQNVTTSSAVIAWVGKEPEPGCVKYGETPRLELKETDNRAGERHAVTLSRLKPSSTYYYRVGGADEPSEINYFRTAPPGENTPFNFAVIGDSGDEGRGQVAVANLLRRLGPDLILHTGDVVYPRGEERHYDRRFFAPYGELIGKVPLFPTLGNHDVETKNGSPFLTNFHLPRNEEQGVQRYYSFDWGEAHFVALDSELYHDDDGGSAKEQKAWLERDLEGTRRSCWKIVFFHRPVYSSSKHGGDRKIREDLEPTLVRHHVHLVFSGHDHDYERTKPIEGVTYVVSGGGGKDLYPARKNRWTAFSRSSHHAVLVHINGEHLYLEAIETNNTVMDRLDLDRGRS